MIIDVGKRGGGSVRWRLLAAAIAVVLVTASCGGGSGGGGEAARTTTTSAPKPNTLRPEGEWTFVSWQTARSDFPELVKGLARHRRHKLTPACPKGPCNVSGAPNGVKGSYLPEELPTAEEPTAGDPYEFVWDAAAKVFTRTDPANSDSCTTRESKTVADAYAVTYTATMTFTPPSGDRPATMHGTYQQKVASTPAGEAAGCTPYEDSGFVVGTPTDALKGDDVPNLAGDYTVTAYFESAEPADDRPKGQSGFLDPMKITGTAPDYSIDGLLDAVTPLTRSGDAWRGEVTQPAVQCDATPPVPDGFTGKEIFEDLQPVALTKDGAPVVSARITISHTANPSGTAVNCQGSTEKFVVLLVPTAAVNATA